MILFKFPAILSCITLSTFFFAFVVSEEGPYEPLPADEICDKCNCTKDTVTSSSESETLLFSIDCSMHKFAHLLREWPTEIGENTSSIEIIFIMSMNDINSLQPLPATDAKILFTCRHCKILEIASHAFIDSPNILSLDLAYNELESDKLTPDIFRGPENDEKYAPIRLQTLRMSHNKLNYLDKLLFEHTPYLKNLDLSHNPIKSFDDGSESALTSLHDLEVFDLSYTQIMEFPGIIIENMQKLKELLLIGNQFLTIPESLISIGKNLKFLHMSENPIVNINEESFVGMERLEYLNISGMPDLEVIEVGSFRPLKSLMHLFCHNNPKLIQMYMEDLRDLQHLKDLDISHNALVSLNFGDVVSPEHENRNHTQFKELRLLKLAGNPWNCDCHMLTSLSIFDHNSQYFKSSKNRDQARCNNPYDLTSKLLYELPIEYVCAYNEKQKEPRIKIYEPPQFLRPKSIMLTVFAVVGVVIMGIIIGFVIVCIKKKLKSSSTGYSSSPIRYTTVRDSTLPNITHQ